MVFCVTASNLIHQKQTFMGIVVDVAVGNYNCQNFVVGRMIVEEFGNLF